MIVTAFASRNGMVEPDRTLLRLRRILEAIEADFAAEPVALSAPRQQALLALSAALDSTEHETHRRRGRNRPPLAGRAVIAFRRAAYRPFISPR
jgi:hypothetical protein